MNPGDKKTYFDVLKKFETTAKKSCSVSENLGDIPTTERIDFAHKLYTKFLMTSLGILRLCPYNSAMPLSHRFWDFFSIASLTRSLFENYAVFRYMALENCSDEEYDFRLQLAIFHWDNEKYQLYKELDWTAEILKEFEDGLPLRAERLKRHPFFSTISKEKRNKLVQGKVFLLKSYYDILKEVDFEQLPVAAMYRFYSNYTHSTAFSVMTMDNERGRGLENEAEIGHITYALEFANHLLFRITQEIIDLLPAGKIKVYKSNLEYFKKI